MPTGAANIPDRNLEEYFAQAGAGDGDDPAADLYPRIGARAVRVDPGRIPLLQRHHNEEVISALDVYRPQSPRGPGRPMGAEGP